MDSMRGRLAGRREASSSVPTRVRERVTRLKHTGSGADRPGPSISSSAV